MPDLRRFEWLIPIVLAATLWEAMAKLSGIPAYIFPSFSHVMATLYFLVLSRVLLIHLVSSLLRVLAGFTLGSLLGIGVGILMGFYDRIYRALHPIFSLLMAIPALGWLPLFIIWIGISDALPVTIIFMCSFFPVLYNTSTGIRSVDRDYIEVARTLGATPQKLLFTVILPLALPSIFTGLRLEAGMAWRVTIAAEMVAIPIGIGALMMAAESLLRIDVIMVCLLTLSTMCFLFEKFFLYLEGKATRWR